MSRGRYLFAAAITVICVLVVAVITAAGSTSNVVPDPVTASEAASELGDVMAVFADEQTPEEKAAAAESAVQEVPELEDGENLALQQQADLPEGGAQVTLWPARRQACFGVDGGGGCIPAQVVESNGVVTWALTGIQLGRGQVRLVGLARNGIDFVEIHVGTPDGESVSKVAIADNAFQADVSGVPVSVRWTDANGNHEGLLPKLSEEDVNAVATPEQVEAMRTDARD